MWRLLPLVLLCLASCTQQSLFDRLASREEQSRAMQVADQLRAGRLAELQEQADPSLAVQLPTFPRPLVQALREVPGNFEIQTINIFARSGEPSATSFVMQAGGGRHWVIVEAVFQGSGSSMKLVGLHASPLPFDPKAAHRFDVGKRGLLGFLWLAAMLACAATCIWAMFLIWRRKWLRRRWLWTLGSLFGFTGFGLNWSNGAWAIQLVNLSLLGATATKVGPYTPWILSFGIPFVALLVIVRWYRREPEHGVEQADDAPNPSESL